MRPKSAASEKAKRRYLHPSKKSKQRKTEDGYSSVTKLSLSRFTSYSRNQNTWQLRKQPLNVCKDTKNIAIIHAYQPQSLKKCLVANPKSYKKFYDSHAGCSLTNLYTKSFLAHFRQWKQSLRQRIINIVNMITYNQKPINEQQINTIFKELQTITEDLKQQTSTIIETKGIQQSKGQARNLHQTFQMMSHYLKHLFSLIKYLISYEKQINAILDQGSKNSSNDLKDVQRQIKKVHKQYQVKIMQNLENCLSHPQSSFMNKSEYKIKVRFDRVEKQAILSLETIMKLKNLILYLKQKLDTLNRNQKKKGEYSAQALQQIILVLNSYQQFKINNKNGNQEGNENPNLIIIRLQNQINSLIQQFSNKFKQSSLFIIKSEYQALRKLKVAQVLFDQPQRWKISKKKFLMLTKIFTKSRDPEYYEKLSSFIKQSSQPYQNITQIVQKLSVKAASKKNYSKENICNIINNILQQVQEYENYQNIICGNIHKLFEGTTLQAVENRSSFKIEDAKLSESQKLKHFSQIMTFSDSKIKQLFVVPKYVTKSGNKIVTKDQIYKAISENKILLGRVANNIFPQAKIKSQELKKYINDDLLSKFLIFSNDILKQPIHSVAILNEFYNKIYGSDWNNKQLNKNSYKAMICYFEQNMNKLENFKNAQTSKKFLQWMFETRISMYVIQNNIKIEQIMNQNTNKQFLSGNQIQKKTHLTYRTNPDIKEFIHNQKTFYTQIIENASKYVREKSIFDIYFQQNLQILQDFIQKQSIFEDYDMSIVTGNYRPTSQALCKWLNWEFNYSIDENITQENMQKIRKNIKGLLNLYIERINSLKGQSSQQNILGIKFVQSCNKVIEDIQNMLQAVLKKQNKPISKSQKIQKYKLIANSILKYLRNNNIYHVAICAKNEEPITFIYQGDGKTEGILDLIQKLLGIPQGCLSRSQENFKLFQIPQIASESNKKQTSQQKQIKNAHFILNQKQYSNNVQQQINDEAIQQYQNQFIQEIQDNISNNNQQIQDQQISEDLKLNSQIKQIKLNKKQKQQITFIFDGKAEKKYKQQIEPLIKQKLTNQVCFIFQGKQDLLNRLKRQSYHKQLSPNSKNIKIKQITKKDLMTSSINQNQLQIKKLPQYRQYIYYKLVQLQSLNHLYESLISMKTELQKIKKNLHISILGLAFESKQPQSQLVSHLDELLKPTQKVKSFMDLFAKNNERPTHRLAIEKLRNSLIDNSKPIQSKQKRQQALKQLFQILDYSYKIIYDEGQQQGNKIILCEVGQSGHYAYAILNNDKPLHKYTNLLQANTMTNLQLMFLKSLFSVPFEQNLHIDSIQKSIKQINNQLKKGYIEIKDNLQGYKEYPIKNNNQMNLKIQTYIKDKCKNKLLMSQVNNINYQSYKKCIMEFSQLWPMFHKQQLIKIYIGDTQELPIYASNNYQDIKYILQLNEQSQKTSFNILPQIYNNSNFVNRRSLVATAINYEQIVKSILNNLKTDNSLQLTTLLDYLQQSYLTYSKKNIIQPRIQQNSQILNSPNIKAYKTIANMGKIIYNQTQIQKRIQQIQRQRDLLQKIKNIRQQNSTFILRDIKQQIQKQNEYITQIQQNQNFIISKGQPKQQIQSYKLQQLCKLLTKSNLKYRKIKYKGQIIGITEINTPPETALMKTLNIGEINNIKYNIQPNSDIIITSLQIEIGLSDSIIKYCSGKKYQKQLLKLINEYSIQINTQTQVQTITNIQILINNYVKIVCAYPRRSIQIKLKKKNNINTNGGFLLQQGNKGAQVVSFIINNYNYGSKYRIKVFQQVILKRFTVEEEKLKQNQQNIKEQQRIKEIQRQQKMKKQLQDLKMQQQLNKLKQLKQQKERKKLKQKLRKELQQQLKKTKQIEVKNKMLKNMKQRSHRVYSQGDRPRRINLQNGITQKYEKLQQLSDDDSIDSIIISENADINRQKLIQLNPIYRFTNVLNVIESSKVKTKTKNKSKIKSKNKN